METNHICNFIMTDTDLYAAGDNRSGQLGIDPSLNGRSINTYMKVPINTIMACVSNNANNTAAIDIDGNLWVCGSNMFGQLGFGDINPRQIFSLVPFNSKIKSVSCGYTHIAVVDEGGSLWVCGSIGVDLFENFSHGQLGLGDVEEAGIFTRVPSNVRFTTVMCDHFQMATIDVEGNLWACGENSYGRLGFGDTDDRNTLTQVPSDTTFQSVYFGENSMLALDVNGNLWSSGAHEFGSYRTLVKFNFVEQFSSFSCCEFYTAAIDYQGNLWVSGMGLEDETDVFTKIPLNVRISMVTCLSEGIVALDVNGNLWVIGHNNHGELGMGQNVAIGNFFVFSIGFPVKGLVNQPVNQLVQRRFYLTKRAR